MLTILSILVTIVISVAGIYFKYFWKKDAVKEVERTNHAMLKDAVDRPSDADVSNELRDGKF